MFISISTYLGWIKTLIGSKETLRNCASDPFVSRLFNLPAARTSDSPLSCLICKVRDHSFTHAICGHRPAYVELKKVVALSFSEVKAASPDANSS